MNNEADWKPATYEAIIDQLILQMSQAVPQLIPYANVNWNNFIDYSDKIHTRFEIPFTTITPVMRRMLYAIGICCRPMHVIGLGTFTGYSITWLLASGFTKALTCVDPDYDAQLIAKKNFHQSDQEFAYHYLVSDEEAAFSSLVDGKNEYDLIYLDIDDRVKGKSGYADALKRYTNLLRPGGWVIAHDTTAQKFKADLVDFHQELNNKICFCAALTLPLDTCGISIIRKNG